jgi:hypothetical protein
VEKQLTLLIDPVDTCFNPREEGEAEDSDRIVVCGMLDLPPDGLGMVHESWRAVKDVDFETDVARAENCSEKTDLNVYFNRERRFIGFDWRLLMTRILLHPDMYL